MTYREAAAYIADVPKFTKKNDAGNTRELLRRLGSPQEAFRTVHVAGTHGKGSVCAFLAQILQDAGYRTGLFTSPHLVRINERFQVNREEISDDLVAQTFAAVRAAIDEMAADGFAHPTYFEILFAMGCVFFAREHVDYAVMETGLGGRLDATNVIEHPSVCVITSVSLDHMEYLGDTVGAIAGEKAGIIKEGVPVVYDASDREAAEVISRTADQRHARAIPFYPGMAQVTAKGREGLRYVLNNRLFDYREVTVPFLAEYQAANSALAMMAARVLDPGKTITDSAMIRSVARTRWSGRMEMILPGVVLDGAHNAAGIRALLKTVEEARKSGPVSLLFSAVADKSYEEMIREICSAGEYDSVVVTQIEGTRKVEAEELARIFRKYTDCEVTAREEVSGAFAYAVSHRPPEGILFCVGSLYLVGGILARIEASRNDA